MNDQTLLIVGWDSASFNIIGDYLEDLENLRSMMEGGVHGDLRTVYPPGTIPGWPCITTGQNPGKINTQRLAPFRRDEFQPNTGEENLEIWDIINHNGGTSCVINIPTIVDAYEIRGAMVAGFLSTTESTITSPPNLFDSLDFDGQLRIGWEEVDRESDIYRVAMDIEEKRFNLVTSLMDRYEWDFFIVNFDAPDRIGHSRLKYIDESHPLYSKRGERRYGDDLRQCYVLLDEMLGKLRDRADNVMVISDHGMEPCRLRFNINDWLIEKEYLILSGDNTSINQSFRSRVLDSLKRVAIERGMVDFVPDFLKRKSVIKAFEGGQHIADVNVDWEATTAYMSAVYGGIDIIGTDKERVKTQLTEDLESFDELDITVIDSDELYHGPNMDNVPDLFLEFNDYVLPTHQVGASELVEPSSTGGMHSMEGIFVADGPLFDQGRKLSDISVLDIAPTAIHAFGCSVPNASDGSVLDIFSTAEEPTYTDYDIGLAKGRDSLTDEEKQAVRETLEDIGYM